uniref:Replication protein E1 n=1 Tax=Kappapapillomavirus 2 TaxID=10623 RepID=Q9IES2_9PAPI|nr:E1 [Kappapapillomavirus 2]
MAEGTDLLDDCGGFLDTEADCLDCDNLEEDLTELFDADTVSSLLDDTDQVQGNSLELFQHQEATEALKSIEHLKRKYVDSPDKSLGIDNSVNALSPRLQAFSLSGQKKAVKKRLFGTDGDEAASGAESLQVESGFGSQQSVSDTPVTDILNANTARVKHLLLFKQAHSVSFSELTRTFQSDKTMSWDWVGGLADIHASVLESLQTSLRSHCVYVQYDLSFAETNASSLLLLLRFKAQKCRDGVKALLSQLLGVQDLKILLEPPKTRSVAVALFWYKRAMVSGVFSYGPMPEWITQQTNVNHQMLQEKPFQLSVMVQWAYDNQLQDESSIAYKYAMLAETDENARAFLASNSQAKYVRDCCNMVRLYLRAEMRQMTMSAWINYRLDRMNDDGDWKVVVHFLRHQRVEFIPFMVKLKAFLRGTPKKNCMVFYGPPNSGKSYFCMSLIRLLAGRVLSFANSRSHFWLQPLADAKLALVDDATSACWDFIDTYLRNALDGNPISVDLKHKAPIEIKCPPLLITTNVDVKSDDRWRYLFSRICVFNFLQELPIRNGTPVYELNDENWKSFFKRFWSTLELSDPEDEGDDGGSQPALRLHTGGTSQSL